MRVRIKLTNKPATWAVALVVTATIAYLPDNPALAQYMQVGVVDQASGYEALTATEQSLHQLDLRRRAKKTEAASKNAGAPTL